MAGLADLLDSACAELGPDGVDEVSMFAREALMDWDRSAQSMIADYGLTHVGVDLGEAILDAVALLDDAELRLARLDAELCPVHGCDFASCYDDDDPECAHERVS